MVVASRASRAALTARRFPPPWSVEEQEVCFVVRDHSDRTLAYVSEGCEHPRKKAAKAALVFEDWNGPTSSQKAVPEADKAY